MDVNKEIKLRPRFYKEVNVNSATILEKFIAFKNNDSSEYFTKIRDNHIFIFIKGEKKQYWSPHLHLELEEIEKNKTKIRGLFGPNQSLWTMFMFLHFIVAGIFIMFGAIAYSNYLLKQSTMLDLIVMFIMVIMWFLLYVIARQIRERGNSQANELEALYLKIIES